MGRSNRAARAPREFELSIDDLGHDGRGVGRVEGKAVFVSGALPGERVRARQTGRNRNFDEAVAIEVLQASPQRVVAKCAHYGLCSGCVLQHLGQDAQIVAKQHVLLENLARIGHVQPGRVLDPLTDAAWGYRRKGRLSVRYVEKKGRTVLGFREAGNPRYVAELSECHTLLPELGQRLPALTALVESLEAKRAVPQIEFIAGDGPLALVFRHLEPLPDADLQRLRAFAQASGYVLYLQPGGTDTVRPLDEDAELSFPIPEFDLRLQFRPLDFIQVNAGLNQKMIARALELLDPQPQDRVLDLFCGLGNFTLPLARRAGRVVGVEGDPGLIARARENAARNGLANVEFHAADLAKDLSAEPWMRAGFDKLLVDPPRAGAAEVLAQLPLKGIGRIVYVSCHPGSLARDAGFLVRERGYRLVAAGAMDMFPQTAHVESIALFEK
jgi:23S rRNA (uracil1939-C5)-methyltransferase